MELWTSRVTFRWLQLSIKTNYYLSPPIHLSIYLSVCLAVALCCSFYLCFPFISLFHIISFIVCLSIHTDWQNVEWFYSCNSVEHSIIEWKPVFVVLPAEGEEPATADLEPEDLSLARRWVCVCVSGRWHSCCRAAKPLHALVKMKGLAKMTVVMVTAPLQPKVMSWYSDADFSHLASVCTVMSTQFASFSPQVRP